MGDVSEVDKNSVGADDLDCDTLCVFRTRAPDYERKEKPSESCFSPTYHINKTSG